MTHRRPIEVFFYSFPIRKKDTNPAELQLMSPPCLPIKRFALKINKKKQKLRKVMFSLLFGCFWGVALNQKKER